VQFGMFMQPSHPPAVSIYDGIQQDLQIIEWLDELATPRCGSAST
jgi:hypothetical protein